MESRPYGSRTQADRREIAENVRFEGLDEASQAAVEAYIRDEIYFCDEGCRAVAVDEIEGGMLVALVPEKGVSTRLLLVAPGSEKAAQLYARDGQLVENAAMAEERIESEGVIELRPFEGQQLYVDGKPASQPFE